MLLICTQEKWRKSWKDIPALIAIWIAVFLYNMWPLPVLAMNTIWKSEKHADFLSYRDCCTAFRFVKCYLVALNGDIYFKALFQIYILYNVFLIVNLYKFSKIKTFKISLPFLWLNFLVNSFCSLLNILNHS